MKDIRDLEVWNFPDGHKHLKEMLSYYMKQFPKGILSVVSDTFDLWKLITEFLPALKEEIMGRDGKLVIRPDSGNPVDIICGLNTSAEGDYQKHRSNHKDEEPAWKGVIELLWDTFGGTINEQGYKVLDSHIGAIYGDSINLERQIAIYERLEAKGFATTNIVLGVGSFTYQMNTRDTLGFAAKGAWFEANGKGYDIYKDPITDDGTKKSLKGMIQITEDLQVHQQVSVEAEKHGILQTIYENGEFYNQITLTEIRQRINGNTI